MTLIWEMFLVQLHGHATITISTAIHKKHVRQFIKWITFHCSYLHVFRRACCCTRMLGFHSELWVHFMYLFFFNGSTALVGPGRYFGFLIYLRAVGLLGRVIRSSQGLYLNTQQQKHRKTHIHTIKHPCPRWDSNPQSRPPSDRRLFMPQTTRLPRPALNVPTADISPLHTISTCY
jgi:hypothetical protein